MRAAPRLSPVGRVRRGPRRDRAAVTPPDLTGKMRCCIGLVRLLRYLLPERPVSLPGKRGAREEVGAVTKPKGRHAKVRKDKGTARKVSELISSIARLIRAVSVLVDALGRWF